MSYRFCSVSGSTVSHCIKALIVDSKLGKGRAQLQQSKEFVKLRR